MTDLEIAALANGMAPFVRECVAESICKSMIIPPELALEVASAVRLLHESPPVAERSEPPPATPRMIRVERDEHGNFVPVYDEPQA